MPNPIYKIGQASNKKRNISNMTLSEIQEAGLSEYVTPTGKMKRIPRPRKQIDKRLQFSLTYWFELIHMEYKKLSPKERAKIALECWKVLIAKANNIPSDPEDSKTNAVEAFNLLKSIETPPVKADNNTPVVIPVDTK